MRWDRCISVFGGVGCTAAYFGHVGRMGQNNGRAWVLSVGGVWFQSSAWVDGIGWRGFPCGIDLGVLACAGP